MSFAPPFMRRLTTRFPQPPDPMRFSDDDRPLATEFPVGTRIFNTSDNAPNFSDGTNWRDSSGNLT